MQEQQPLLPSLYAPISEVYHSYYLFMELSSCYGHKEADEDKQFIFIISCYMYGRLRETVELRRATVHYFH